ncbi:MAG: hypothetical protein MJ245_00670 [Clostridia bacterium]|nr:hypothetical protein [Clostridia bacterium]
MNNYKYYLYNGNFTMVTCLIKTFIFSAIAVMIIILGAILTVVNDLMFALPLSLVIFIVCVTWYIIYMTRLAIASLTVLVRDFNNLWILTNNSVPKSNKKYAMFNPNRISFCNSYIDDVKKGRKTCSLSYGKSKYMILENFHIVKENKKYYFVEALVTTNKKKQAQKIVRIAKTYDDIKEALQGPKPYEPFGFSDGRD